MSPSFLVKILSFILQEQNNDQHGYIRMMSVCWWKAYMCNKEFCPDKVNFDLFYRLGDYDIY